MSSTPLFMLTNYTGVKASQGRPIVIATVETNTVLLISCLISAGIAAPVALVFSIFRNVAVTGAAFFVAFLIALWLVHGESSGGLRQKNHRRLMDHMKFQPDVFKLCGAPIDPLHTQVGVIMSSSVPVASSMKDSSRFDAINQRETWEVDLAELATPVRPPAPRLQARPASQLHRVAPAAVSTGDLFTN